MAKTIVVKQTGSPIRRPKNQRAILIGLGFFAFVRIALGRPINACQHSVDCSYLIAKPTLENPHRARY